LSNDRSGLCSSINPRNCFASQIPLAILVLCAISVEAQTRRVRLRARPIQQVESAEEEASEEVQQPVQYFRPQPKQDNSQELVYVNEEEYQNLYGQSTPAARQREYRPIATTVRPLPRAQPTQSLAPRTKEPEAKAPPVQTIRNYNKVNDDGSFTFGYEAADGSFKEETRGTDCVVRGRYGYVDPEGELSDSTNRRTAVGRFTPDF
jgi:Insect cuticle protein